VTRYLLDTNILSNATKAIPSSALISWLSEQDDASLFISYWTIAEIMQ